MISNAFAYRNFALFVVVLFALCGLSASGQNAAAPLSLETAPAAQKPAASVAASSEADETPTKADASHQGIKVHGHWKIVVKNSDGSVAHTHEFENSLTSTGSLVVASIMSGQAVSGGHGIFLFSSGTSICGNGNACGIVPVSVTTGPFSFTCANGANSQPMSCVTGMTETVNNVGGFVLAGQTTATQAGTVTQVQTQIADCIPTITASACPAANNGNGSLHDFSFTSANLPTAITVSSGQIVQVTVTITFS